MSRLYDSAAPESVEGAAKESWHLQAHEELAAAASRIISTLETMVGRDMPLYHRQGMYVILCSQTPFPHLTF
jgi:uncharacterized protein (UPF0147 family)